jgi:hypothetical protein
MNSHPFLSMRLLFLVGVLALLCNISMVAQAPKSSTSPSPASPNRYMATITRFHKAISSGDTKTIIDLSYFHQTALGRSLQGEPQAVWPQLKEAYYKSVSTGMATQPDALGAIREGAASMEGDPTQNIRMIRGFLPSSATIKFLEQRPVTAEVMTGQFSGMYVFVGVSYPDLASSPIANVNFVRYIILRFLLTSDTALISSVSTVPASQQVHTKPYPVSALGYVESVFFSKYLSVYNDPNLWKAIEQEALSIGNDFAIQLYTSIAQSHPNQGPISVGWPDPRVTAVQILNRLQYKGLNALLVPLITPGEYNTGVSVNVQIAAIKAVLSAGGSRNEEPTATLRERLMKGLSLETLRGPTNGTPDAYLAALSRLDGQEWGPTQLYMPQPPGGDMNTLYARLFTGLVSDVTKYIDPSSPDTSDFAAIRPSLVKCAPRDSLGYSMGGCKGEFILEKNTIIDNGRIECTATIKDTSHIGGIQEKDAGRLLFTVDMTLVPQGQNSYDWKVVALKILNSGSAPTAAPAEKPTPARGEGTVNDGEFQKLSGRWKLTSESNSQQPSPKEYELEVKGPMITIGSPGGSKGTHYIDGRPSVYPGGGRLASARWTDNVLVIDARASSSNGGGSQTRVSYSVSSDGRTLTRRAQQILSGRTVSENTATYSRE